MDFCGWRPRHRKPGKVALHVGDEARDPGRRHPLDDPLQGHRLASSGRSGDQPVAVGTRQLQPLGLASPRLGADEDVGRRFTRHGSLPA